jgi:hypothetical protein
VARIRPDAGSRRIRPSRPSLSLAFMPQAGIVSAHRGSSRDGRPVAPEGSLSAYRLAMAQGAHLLDVDYQTTSDGVPVVMHDPTVDATTAGTGTVASFTRAGLPAVSMPEVTGSGWAPEPVPTLAELFSEFGGRVFLTVEPKGGAAGVPALAALIHAHGLAGSVFVNGSDPAVVSAAVAAGCLGHMYGVTTTAGVDAAQTAGASLVELPYNAAQSLVDYARARIPRVIAAPIFHFAQLDALTPGLQGYVSDALGYLNRPGGAAQRSVSSIAAAVAAGKRGAGWRRVLGSTAQVPITTDGLTIRDALGTSSYHLGDLSGDMPASGSIQATWRLTALPTNLPDRIGLRVMAPEETATAQDTDTKGYVLGLRMTGQLHLWASPVGPALAVDTPYTLLFEWTPTQVRLSRYDGGVLGVTTGWVANTLWRGRNFYTNTTVGTTALVRLTDLSIT